MYDYSLKVGATKKDFDIKKLKDQQYRLGKTMITEKT